MERRAILIIGDSGADISPLRELFEDDFEIMEAGCGQDGLELMNRRRDEIAAVLLSLAAPGMGGLEFVERFKEDRDNDTIPVIMITDRIDPKEAHIALDQGVLDVIRKPYDPYIAQKRVYNLINLYQAKADREQVEIDRHANEMRSRFLANMSHEIRTPMNAVLGMAEIGLNETSSDEKDRCLNQIRNASEHMLSIINDILDISKLESGKYEIIEAPYSIGKLVDDVVNIISTRMSEKNVELIVELDPSTPSRLYGDEARIRQIFLNIATNAVKFTGQGFVKFVIHAEPEESGVRLYISVKDTGIGIKDEVKETIFDAFVQADKRYSRLEGGIGLGLAISKQLADLMGGSLSLESEYGKGSEFTLALMQKVEDPEPCVSLHNARAQRVAGVFENVFAAESFAALMGSLGVTYADMSHDMTAERLLAFAPTHVFAEKEKIASKMRLLLANQGGVTMTAVVDALDYHGGENSVPKPLYCLPVAAVLNNENYRDYFTAASDQDYMFTAPDISVLVVDDNFVNLRVTEGLLKPYKVRVTSAISGAEAIDIVQEEKFDMIFMDHMMPGMDGIEATKHIRAMGGEYETIPIIALTANAMKGAEAKFMAVGMNGFIAKPVSGRELAKFMRRWLPAEKVIPGGGDGEEREKQSKELPVIDGMDVKSAVRFTGGVDTYMRAVGYFYRSIDEKASLIDELCRSGDIENYTIQVHALKTSARLVGATELACLAERLEMCGKNEDADTIEKETPGLIEIYRSLSAVFAPYVPESDEIPESDKKSITSQQLREKLGQLIALSEDFDIDGAETWSREMACVAVDRRYEPMLRQVRSCVKSIDYSGMAEKSRELLKFLI